MEKSLACGDVVPGCKAVLHGKDEKEVLDRAAAHAKKDHKMETMPSDITAKAKAAIKDKH